MQLLVMNFFTNAADTILMFYFLFKLFDKKNLNKKKIKIILLLLTILTTFIDLMFTMRNVNAFIAIFIVSTIFFSYILEEGFYITLFHGILGVILLNVIEVITVSLIIMVCKVPISAFLEMNIYRIVGIIISKVLLYLTIRYLIDKLGITKIPKHYNIKDKMPIIMISCLSVVIIAMTLSLYKNVELKFVSGYIYLLGIGISSTLLNIIIYSTSKKIIYQNQVEKVCKGKEDEFHRKDFYIKNMNDVLETIKLQRHELANYMDTLNGLMQLENCEDARTYIKKINDRVTNMNSIIETNQPVITSLISIKRNKAFENDIDMTFDIDLEDKLPFDFVDLSIIIGNLLDNAIKACLLIDKESERNINLSMKRETNSLKIETRNNKKESIKLEIKKVMKTFVTKTDLRNSGLELENIEFIVKQYNGTVDIEDLGKEFIVSIDLPMVEDVNSEIKS